MENVNQVIADILSQDDIAGGYENPWGGIWGGADAAVPAVADSAAVLAGGSTAACVVAGGVASGLTGGSSAVPAVPAITGGSDAPAESADLAGGKRKLPEALRENHRRVMEHYNALVAKYGKGGKKNGKNLMRVAMEMTKKRSKSKRKHSKRK